MLIWVCALHCEAKPVVDRYRMKKAPGDPPFDTWTSDGMVCVVSGVGKLAAAAASAWSAARLAEQPALAWLNLGTAGADAELGSAFDVDKIVDADSGECYYPVPVLRSPLPGAVCHTLAAPSEDYRNGLLYDMEASGYFASAARFSSAELIQSIKVVSDNPARQTGRDRQAISDLVHGQMDAVAARADALRELAREVAGRALPAASFERLLALAHFTATEQNQARVLWRYLANREHHAEALLDELGPLGSARRMIARLEQISRGDAEGL